MNPLLSGISVGVLVAVGGFALVWPALGRDFGAVFARVVAAFLLKLGAVTAGIVLVHAFAGREPAVLFASGLLGAYLPLLLLSLAPLRRRLDRLDRLRPAGDATAAPMDETSNSVKGATGL
jgi:hypothetical protein